LNERFTHTYSSQAGAYKSYAQNLLHILLWIRINMILVYGI